MAAVSSGVWGAPLAYAQDEARIQKLEQKLESLDQELRIVKRQLENERESATNKAKETAVVVASKDGFALQSADKNFQLKVKGYIQADGRFFAGNEPANSTFLSRRVRPIIDGVLYKDYEFRLMPDFGNGTTALVDAYIDANYWKELKFRVGKFKAPVGLERLQSVTDDPFVEFGMPVNLYPNRDTGAQVSGDLFDNSVSYALGIFNGTTDAGSTDLDTDDDKDLAFRVFAQPFKQVGIEPLEGLGVGVATTYGHREGTPSSYRTPGQQNFFSYRSDTFNDGVHKRIVPQAAYYWGPLGVLAEYANTSQKLKRGGVTDNVDAWSWQIATSYILTGEDNSYKGIKIRHPFSLQEGTWGAAEAVARFSSLWVDGDVLDTFANPTTAANRADEFTVGLNWHLNKNVKWMTDYSHTSFNRGDINGDRDNENVIIARLQLVY